MNIIRNIISRDCHVTMSNRKVIKHVIGKLVDGYTTFKALDRKDRRLLMTACIKEHTDNIKEYNFPPANDSIIPPFPPVYMTFT